MTWCFSFKKLKSATLPMIQQYIHAHQILKRRLWNYLTTRIWFLIGLKLIVWWRALANFRLFLGSNIDNTKITFMIENKRVKSRSEVKLLGITIDYKLSFNTHIENLCSTASNHLRALARIRKYLSFEQATRLSQA